MITNNPHTLKIQEKIRELDKLMSDFDILNAESRIQKEKLEQELIQLQIKSREFTENILSTLKKEVKEITKKQKSLKDVKDIKQQYQEAIQIYRTAEKVLLKTREFKKQLREEMKKCQIKKSLKKSL